jgi:electron transport complex protein RnfC
MLRVIKAEWSHPDIPDAPQFCAPAGDSWPPSPARQPLRHPDQPYTEFLDAIGLLGMGGSMFPASRKIAASDSVHTLVINAVECEPGTTIDKSLLLHHSSYVRAGAEASAAACGAPRVVIAIARNRKLSARLAELYKFDLVSMPQGYPSGAERLIVKKVTGKHIPAGFFPGCVGVLVQNVASLRAIGRALVDNIPVVERPLTLAVPQRSMHRDVIVPVGMLVGDVLSACEISWNADQEVLIAGGLMMGKMVQPDTQITKGTTSIVIMPRASLKRTQSHCINCGACNVVCPLGLHPVGMTKPVREAKVPLAASVSTQLNECFLCGACAAVCPAHIPLVEYIREGKACQQTP